MKNHSLNIDGPQPREAIGVVSPFDMELDGELWRWLPDDVELLMTRTPFVDKPVTVEFAKDVSDHGQIVTGVKSVIAGRANVVAYACTSGSFVGGKAGEQAIRDVMDGAGSQGSVTASGALAEALQSIGAKRVSVVTPYLPDLSRLLDSFLGEHDIHVVENSAMGLDSHMWEVSYRQTAEMIRAVDSDELDAIVTSCTNLPTYDLIAPLERELGKPIISANQALMWATLKRLGKNAVGAGQALPSPR